MECHDGCDLSYLGLPRPDGERVSGYLELEEGRMPEAGGGRQEMVGRKKAARLFLPRQGPWNFKVLNGAKRCGG